jgi:hypothetical protein
VYKNALRSKNGTVNFRSLYNKIAELYVTMKQYDTAFFYKNESMRTADSIYNSELKEHVVFENKRIELLEKDYQNQVSAKDLKKNNVILISIVLTLIAIKSATKSSFFI